MTLDVLLSLKQQELLAKFGYFDLDAAISAAFIFILVESLQSVGSSRSGLHGIRSATSILQYLIKHGNKAAVSTSVLELVFPLLPEVLLLLKGHRII